MWTTNFVIPQLLRRLCLRKPLQTSLISIITNLIIYIWKSTISLENNYYSNKKSHTSTMKTLPIPKQPPYSNMVTFAQALYKHWFRSADFIVLAARSTTNHARRVGKPFSSIHSGRFNLKCCFVATVVVSICCWFALDTHVCFHLCYCMPCFVLFTLTTLIVMRLA